LKFSSNTPVKMALIYYKKAISVRQTKKSAVLTTDFLVELRGVEPLSSNHSL